MARKKEPSHAEIHLELKKSLGLRAKLNSKAGIQAMRERIVYLESEIAALDVQMSKAETSVQIGSVIAHAEEIRKDLKEAQTRLKEYTAQHEGRN